MPGTKTVKFGLTFGLGALDLLSRTVLGARSEFDINEAKEISRLDDYVRMINKHKGFRDQILNHDKNVDYNNTSTTTSSSCP